MRPQEFRDEKINRKSVVSFDFARILPKKSAVFNHWGKNPHVSFSNGSSVVSS